MMSTTFNRRRILAMASAAAFGAVLLGSSTIGLRAAEGDAKGKTVEYITFGLQFEYQVAMVEGVKKRAEEAQEALRSLALVEPSAPPNAQAERLRRRLRKDLAVKPRAVIGPTIEALGAVRAEPEAAPTRAGGTTIPLKATGAFAPVQLERRIGHA